MADNSTFPALSSKLPMSFYFGFANVHRLSEGLALLSEEENVSRELGEESKDIKFDGKHLLRDTIHYAPSGQSEKIDFKSNKTGLDKLEQESDQDTCVRIMRKPWCLELHWTWRALYDYQETLVTSAAA
ncbi:hypothetical protein RRG08_040876 [Elysia crispata]|uniref:Uncharacterized protein n=1 Tax=Elysia crispata TaxID=231223 RepID=A0AAE1E7H7_9GAST|nr:hypothetical protein RRG08_040876 [Elysia crispata]